MSETVFVNVGGEQVSVTVEGGNMAAGASLVLGDLNSAAARAEQAATDAEAAVAMIPGLVADRALTDGTNVSPVFLDNIGDTRGTPLSFQGAFQLKNIGGVDTPEPGLYIGSGGNSLTFQTLVSSPSGTPDLDNQRATLLVASTTTDDGNSEEQSLCVLTTIKTGYSRVWANSTAFALGDNVSFGGARNTVYRCITAGISAASGTGPTGQGQDIVDGTVHWRWINDAAINSKTGTYLETVVAPGAGSSWGFTNNVHIAAGVISPFVAGFEQDLTNYSGQDSVIGGPDPRNKLGGWIALQGDTRSTAALQISSANTANDAAIWGAYFAGDRLASNAVIGIDASSAIGIGAGAGAGTALTPTFTTAFIRDRSISPTGLSLAGTYSSAQISLPQGGGAPAAISISGTKTLSAYLDASTAPKAIAIQGVNSVAAIEVTATTPASFSSSGAKTITGFSDTSSAPYGFNAGGTYSTAAFASTGFSVLPDGSVQAKALVFTTIPSNFADDAAAATGGIVVGGVYRTGSALKVRVS